MQHLETAIRALHEAQEGGTDQDEASRKRREVMENKKAEIMAKKRSVHMQFKNKPCSIAPRVITENLLYDRQRRF